MISRRHFCSISATAFLPATGVGVQPSQHTIRIRPGGQDNGFDPWIEIDAGRLRHNSAEVGRAAGGRPILAVVKNNAYGLGDTVVGPILASCPEVAGIACVRVSEAIAMREIGVTKPILNMAEVSEEEILELASRQIWPSLWLDDAGERIDRVAKRLRRPIAVHLYIDTGLGREGMPYHRALPWIEGLASRQSVRIDGTYTMFVQELEFDREQLGRFLTLKTEAEQRGVRLGRIHAAPTFEVFHFPEAHLDMVRPGSALFGFVRLTERAQRQADVKMVFRLCARVSRVERLREGDSAGFERSFRPKRSTWIATIPVGVTDGYPAEAANTCDVLIGESTYRVVVVNNAHVVVDVGSEQTVRVGDRVVLIGPDHPAVHPSTIGMNAKLKSAPNPNAFLPRRIV